MRPKPAPVLHLPVRFLGSTKLLCVAKVAYLIMESFLKLWLNRDRWSYIALGLHSKYKPNSNPVAGWRNWGLVFKTWCITPTCLWGLGGFFSGLFGGFFGFLFVVGFFLLLVGLVWFGGVFCLLVWFFFDVIHTMGFQLKREEENRKKKETMWVGSRLWQYFLPSSIKPLEILWQKERKYSSMICSSIFKAESYGWNYFACCQLFVWSGMLCQYRHVYLHMLFFIFKKSFLWEFIDGVIDFLVNHILSLH